MVWGVGWYVVGVGWVWVVGWWVGGGGKDEGWVVGFGVYSVLGFVVCGCWCIVCWVL